MRASSSLSASVMGSSDTGSEVPALISSRRGCTTRLPPLRVTRPNTAASPRRVRPGRTTTGSPPPPGRPPDPAHPRVVDLHEGGMLVEAEADELGDALPDPLLVTLEGAGVERHDEH